MDRILGWLSDLGESTFHVGSRTSLPGAKQQYTLTLRYTPDGPGTIVTATNRPPHSLDIDIASLSGGATYDPTRRQITWSGFMQPGQIQQITYEATPVVDVLPGEFLENRVDIHYEDHDLRFERTARTWIAAADLSPSRVDFNERWVRPGQNATVELTLLNEGSPAPITAGLRFPAEVTPLTSTLKLSSGQAQWAGQHLTWSAWLDHGRAITASIAVTTTLNAAPDWLPFTAVIQDGLTDPVITSSFLEIRPHRSYLPVAFLNKP
jgi:hypothetical protein